MEYKVLHGKQEAFQVSQFEDIYQIKELLSSFHLLHWNNGKDLFILEVLKGQQIKLNHAIFNSEL